MQKSTRVNLTKNRARLVIEKIVPFLEVNYETGSGDLFGGESENWDKKDLEDLSLAIVWIYEQGRKHFTRIRRKQSHRHLSGPEWGDTA